VVILKTAILINILIFTISILWGQTVKDTVPLSKRGGYDQFVLPSALMAGSVILYGEPVRREIQRIFPNTRTRVDDWLRYGPVFQLYAYDLLGFKHRSPVLVQTGNLLLSQLITSGIVSRMKGSIDARRPSGGIHSYPSGHTSAAFVGATVLYLEFRDTEPLLAWSGFALATATGLLRVTNDAHWLPDVMAGAAVGMLVTRLVYGLDPLGKLRILDAPINVSFKQEENMNFFCLLFSF